MNWSPGRQTRAGTRAATMPACSGKTTPGLYCRGTRRRVDRRRAITSYQGEYGFMGFFIVRPEYRGRGPGNELWHARRDRLIERLQPGATIGMDGVFDMQDYYQRRFRFPTATCASASPFPPGSACREAATAALCPGAAAPEQLAAYDRSCFSAPRTTFIRTWVSQPDSPGAGICCKPALAGFGVIRRCGEGCKIGPLFADDAQLSRTRYSPRSPASGRVPRVPGRPGKQPGSHATGTAIRHDRGIWLRARTWARCRISPTTTFRRHHLRARMMTSRDLAGYAGKPPHPAGRGRRARPSSSCSTLKRALNPAY